LGKNIECLTKKRSVYLGKVWRVGGRRKKTDRPARSHAGVKPFSLKVRRKSFFNLRRFKKETEESSNGLFLPVQSEHTWKEVTAVDQTAEGTRTREKKTGG